jgi:hypothetical protein
MDEKSKEAFRKLRQILVAPPGADLVEKARERMAELERAKALKCSHATGPHDRSCDLVAGLERENAELREQLESYRKAVLLGKILAIYDDADDNDEMDRRLHALFKKERKGV